MDFCLVLQLAKKATGKRRSEANTSLSLSYLIIVEELVEGINSLPFRDFSLQSCRQA